jgi:hypothetical protein
MPVGLPALLVAFGLAVAQQPSAPAPSTSTTAAPPAPTTIDAQTDATRAEWDLKISHMVRRGELKLTKETPSEDGTRREQWFVQLHKGVPVVGTEVWRESEENKTVAIEGTLFTGIVLNPVPRLTREEALAAFVALANGGPGPSLAPVLMVLPQPAGKFVLVYQARVFTGTDLTLYAIDGSTGAVVQADREMGAPR